MFTYQRINGFFLGLPDYQSVHIAVVHAERSSDQDSIVDFDFCRSTLAGCLYIAFRHVFPLFCTLPAITIRRFNLSDMGAVEGASFEAGFTMLSLLGSD